MRVVAIDPSLTGTGICAVDLDTRSIRAWECIRTAPSKTAGRRTDDLARRLTEVAAGVSAFLARWPGVVVLEAQTPSSHGRASMANAGLLMAAYGACIGALGGRKPIILMPSEVRRRVTGRTGATKTEAWMAAKAHFSSYPDPLRSRAALEAVHDAVCVALAARPELHRLKELI